MSAARGWFYQAGGVNPYPATEPPRAYRRLKLAEREEIACAHARGDSIRSIAASLGRSPATISRELARNTTGARPAYRPARAQQLADERATRSAPVKLTEDSRLCQEVQARLEDKYSPEQIAGRLPVDFPNDASMRVSHETIYQSLYVQSRGALNRELTRHLRTGRRLRKPHRKPGERRGKITGMVNISHRPATIEDRAVPGHWEGDLILGSTASASAIGTLVERTSRYCMLLHLPDNHTALAVQEAMIAAMSQLPATLRRTLTWDQGHEMANHATIAHTTGLDIYFCDPHSPWQRGTNENTNGLLRQYFPKGTDLSKWGPGYLDNVAAELNSRPRKRLAWRTPAEALDQLLSKDTGPHGVATTA